ncbi:MAG TPA: response regulator [Pseudomonadales bacterium]
MFNLDTPLLRVAAPLLLTFTIATLVLLWHTKKLENRMTCWTGGLVCYAAGFMLTLFSAQLPQAFNIAIDIAFVASMLLFLQALRATYELVQQQTATAVIGLLTLVISTWFHLFSNTHWPAFVWRHLMVGLIAAACVNLLWRREDLHPISAEAAAIVLFVAFGALQFLVVGYLLVTPGIEQDYLDAAQLGSRFFITLLTLSFLLIAYGRLDREHRSLVAKVKQESLQHIQGLESRWLMALEYSQAGAWEYDPKKREAQYSEQWAHLLGLKPRIIRLRATDLLKYMHTDDWPRFEADMKAYVDGRTPYFENEHRLQHADGHWIWVSSRGRFLDDPGNPNRRRIAGTDIDITARKQDEERMQHLLAESEKAKDQAVQASKAKSAFLANVSHEIRSPMNAILGFSQLLKDDQNLTPTQRDNLEIINSSGQHLLALIDDILNLSRIESGNFLIHLQPLNPGLFLNEVVQFYLRRPIKHGVVFEPVIAANLPPVISTDPRGVRQVCMNLLTNAFKFTERGRVVFRANIEQHDLHHGMLVIEVSDTGVGIGEKDLNLIFNAFEQTHYGAVSAEGYGLGLSICKNIVQLLGGTLDVESALNKGSKFTLKVPVAIGAEAGANAEASSNYADRPETDLSAFKLLIVDDIESNRRLLRELLEKSRIGIREAATAQEALDATREWRPSLVLMDIRMPAMSGCEAISELRREAEFTKLPIIAISANATGSERERVLGLGATDFVTKPFTKDELYRKVMLALNLPLITRQPMSTTLTPKLQAGMSPAHEAAGPVQQAVASSGSLQSDAPAKPRILVVDDSSANQQLLTSQLRALGLTAEVAANGQIALAKWEQQHYPLIFADCTMPVMNGMEMARRIRALERDDGRGQAPARIIAITGAPEDYRVECIKAGMNEVLGKPLLLKALKQAIDNHLPAATA